MIFASDHPVRRERRHDQLFKRLRRPIRGGVGVLVLGELDLVLFFACGFQARQFDPTRLASSQPRIADTFQVLSRFVVGTCAR